MEEKGDDASPLLYQHTLSSLPPIWFMDSPGEEDESHPPSALSWQPAKAGPAWWDAPLGLGRRLSFLLHLPQFVPLEWNGESSVEKLTFFLCFLFPTSYGCLLFPGGWGLRCGLGSFSQSSHAFQSFFGVVRMRWSPGGSCFRC